MVYISAWMDCVLLLVTDSVSGLFRTVCVYMLVCERDTQTIFCSKLILLIDRTGQRLRTVHRQNRKGNQEVKRDSGFL